MGWRYAAAALILAVSAFRVAYVGWWSPLDLAQDEAHYWDWARNLDWSYYSKGPLVAWLIRGSLELFGPLSISLTDSTVLAIRFPAVLCGAALLAAIYTLTVQSTGRDSLAFATTAVTAAMPAVTAAGILMTIDAPFVTLWAWACVFGHAALFGNRPWAWPALGLTLGLGILAKYTMLVWPASAVLFCLFTPTYRNVLIRPGMWLAAAVAALCCLPILIWNIQNDWVSLRHVAGQAGVTAPEAKGVIRWLGPLEFLGAQMGVGLGIFFVVLIRSLFSHRPGAEADPKRLYLWWLCTPTFALFLLVSFRVGIQVNWPAAGYVSGMVLSAIWLAERIATPENRGWKIAVLAGAVVAFLGTVVALQPSTMKPVVGRLVGPATEKSPAPMRRWDPTCRLRGWKWLAGEVDRMRDELTKRDGMEPVLAVDRWNKAGELGYYCRGNPTVVCLGRAVGDRYSQYDLWRPNPIDDAQAYAGRTFLIVGEPKDGYDDAFAGYDERNLTTLDYREGGELVARWYVTVGTGYRGFPAGTRGGKW
jgi:4-amino-4-deoxy-L-arabinose transferase-like glycosyltransferase